MWRVVWVVLLLVLIGVPVAVYQRWLDIPARWNPWAPLNVQESPNLLTAFKLMRLQQDRELCAEALASSNLTYVSLPDSAQTADCPLENTVRVQGSDMHFTSYLATCKMAVAFALFERHGLQPAAREVFGQPVARIEHFGSFACRNIGNSQRRSQHASANALDIAGFQLRDGQRITLARDWQGEGDKALFLRKVHEAACRQFNVTLGPAYNAAHRDHFHVDMGLFHLCR